jgi:hypothetical protein
MTHDTIDLDLVDKTIALIPENAWIQVRQAIVTALVDNMPGFALEKLTGTYDDFDRAEEILNPNASDTSSTLSQMWGRPVQNN